MTREGAEIPRGVLDLPAVDSRPRSFNFYSVQPCVGFWCEGLRALAKAAGSFEKAIPKISCSEQSTCDSAAKAADAGGDSAYFHARTHVPGGAPSAVRC